MDIKRHSWLIEPERDVVECVERRRSQRRKAECSGCGARVSLNYLEIQFAASSDIYADADLMASCVRSAA
jgi:hypothetical protein